MDWPVTYERRIRFPDSDAQGIVFNGNYLTYWDDTITDSFDALGLGWDGMVEQGYEMVPARVEGDFRSSARIGDGEILVEGRQLQVIVDHEEYRPVPVPEFLAEAVTRLQGSRP
jgi:acyl-CoA thioester hydrolase